MTAANSRSRRKSGDAIATAEAPAPGEEMVMSGELAESLLNAMQEGVIVFDKAGRPVYCNQRSIEITGLTLEQRMMASAEDLAKNLVLEDGSPHEASDLPSAVVMRTGRGHAVTHGLLRDGGIVWLDVNAEPIFSAGTNELFGCCVVIRDVTDRRASEEALRASEEMKGAVMSASVDAILTIDVDGRIIDLNRAAERLYKTTRAAVGENLNGFIPWRDRQVWAQILERLETDPKHFRGRRLAGTGQRSDGSEFPLEATIDSLEASGHQLLVAFIRDVTERRAAERRLADARDAALRASVVKSEFLATMSHEIRTPMNGVIGSLDLILDSDLADDLRELATIARTSAHDLLAIIDDILDLSKIEADKLDSQTIEFDLAAIVEGVTDIVAVPARHKGLSLSCFVDPRAPSAVRGDARLLRQVLVNLVGNAVKFTDSGEVAIRAEVQPSGENELVVQFSVSDSGIGIPTESLEKLFEPFTQVDGSSTRAHGGTGLGLAISSRLVRLMGGQLGVESTVGQGSTFSFSVPFELPDRSVGPAYAPNPHGRPLRVLVVEASPSAAETIERYLRAWGMVTTRTTTPAAAIERYNAALEHERFDVAIIALSQGDETGPALARELHDRAGDDGVFVIALVDIGGRLAEVDTSPEAAQTFDAVIAKPIKQSRLYDALAGVDSVLAIPDADDGERPAQELDGLRILIAEDNPVNKQVLMRQATRLGLIATAVENGQEALDALAGGDYDAILMDCQMPVMDGYEATRAIRERESEGGPRIPIVAVTANAMREDFDRCRDAGMDDFVAKPVTLAALTSAIERAVSANRPPEVTPAATPRTAAAPTNGAQSQQGTPIDDFGIDRAALAALQEDVGGAAALARIVRLFLEQLDPQAAQIAQAASAGEHETLARTAHRMKSSSATLGATTLAEALEELETAAGNGDAAACDRLASTLAAAVQRARAAFEGVMEGLEAAN
jgi:two-component system, sensor histidine kinase and response regulator